MFPEFPESTVDLCRVGVMIPALPLALNNKIPLDEPHQMALLKYYL